MSMLNQPNNGKRHTVKNTFLAPTLALLNKATKVDISLRVLWFALLNSDHTFCTCCFLKLHLVLSSVVLTG